MLRVVTILVCLTGAGCTLASYSRYRDLAGSVVCATWWPLSSVYLAGPFIVTAVASGKAKSRPIASWAVLLGALILASLSLTDLLTEVPLGGDPEIDAAFRLEGAACVQFIGAVILMLVALGASKPPDDPSTPS